MALLPSVSDAKSMAKKGDRDGIPAAAIHAGSLALHFVSRSVMLVASGAIGQFIVDWCVAAGAPDIICTIGIEAFRVGTGDAPGRVPRGDFIQPVSNARLCFSPVSA